MPRLVHLGRVLLGFGMIALGGMGIAFADFMLEWSQVPGHLPVRAVFAYVHGFVLVVCGLGLFFKKTIGPAALVLGTVWLIWTLLCIPLVIATWRGRAGLQAEILGMTSGIFTLTALVGSRLNRTQVLVCRYAFALCLPVYGLVHFLYPSGVASWVPKWLPWPLFWAYFTGVAHCAAGLALLTGVLSRLATRLFAIMLSSWVLIVHIPRVAVALHDRHEWTTLFVAVSLSGVAWIIAGSLMKLPAKREF
jgi:uncharacterized membrane protein